MESESSCKNAEFTKKYAGTDQGKAHNHPCNWKSSFNFFNLAHNDKHHYLMQYSHERTQPVLASDEINYVL